jgi:trans-2,3-dihydro-3-hydroxyanthranilate isomerase
MPTYEFMQVDAFTHRPLGGNPCAVLFDTQAMEDATMLAIAKEMNLSETAFVQPSQTCDFAVRYFTPAEEIPLAGHPTIATTYALIATGRLAVKPGITTLSLELTVGPIAVEVYSSPEGIDRIMMTQLKPQFLGTLPPENVMPVFGLQTSDILPNAPIEIVSTGTPQLMIPVNGPDALRRAQLNIPAYTALREKAAFFSPHLFCLGGATPEGDTFARHFGVPPDTMEDPFTGSATGGMAAYLWHHNLIERQQFVAEQGHWMGRPGQARVEIEGSRLDIQSVRVGGQAVAVLHGRFKI